MANFTEITSKTTTVIKFGAGVLESILVSGAGASWTIQVFDANDATTPTNGRAIFGATAVTVPAAGTSIVFGEVTGCHFSQGLIIVTAGTTAGELTVFWH